jgi:DNA-binding response OmpR family regulator
MVTAASNWSFWLGIRKDSARTALREHSPVTIAAVRLLIVEDDLAIAEPLLAGLRHHGFDGTHVSSGSEAIALVTQDNFDVVLLDLGLPDMDGLDVCREIRKRSFVPIIMVTARAEEIDRIVGLELGADDYVSKPFGIRELIARVRAVRRRFDSASELTGPAGLSEQRIPSGAPTSASDLMPGIAAARIPNVTAPGREPLTGVGTHFSPAVSSLLRASDADATNASNTPNSDGASSRSQSSPLISATMNIGALVVDHRTHRVHLGGVEIPLTPKEFGLLVVLGADPGAVVPRMSIIEQVWDEHWYGPTKTLDVHIAQLRQKLGNPAWIETVRGVGYRLVDPALDDLGTD